MTIRIGQATVLGDQVLLAAPGGFNTFKALRLSNFTGDAIIVRNISGTSIGEEYLLPSQSMVYHTDNVSTIPTLQGLNLGLTTVSAVLVEWSDDPLNDFIGTYPTSITLPVVGTTASVSLVSLPAPGTTFTIAAQPLRVSLTVINESPTVGVNAGAIEWSSVNSGWGSNPRIIVQGGRTTSGNNALYFRALDANSKIEVISEVLA